MIFQGYDSLRYDRHDRIVELDVSRQVSAEQFKLFSLNPLDLCNLRKHLLRNPV